MKLISRRDDEGTDSIPRRSNNEISRGSRLPSSNEILLTAFVAHPGCRVYSQDSRRGIEAKFRLSIVEKGYLISTGNHLLRRRVLLDSMRRILFVITKDDVGGAQKYVQELAEHLDPQKFQVKILKGGRGGVRFLSNALRPYFLFLNDLLAIGELIFIFRREKPDIVHLNSSKAGIVGALAAWLYKLSLKLYPIPYTLYPRVVFTAHGWVFNPDNSLSWPRRYFYTLLHKIAARFQDVIISVSEYDHQLALRHRIAPPEKLMTIYNGIDHEKIKFLDKAAARRGLLKLINSPSPVPTNSSTHQLINSPSPVPTNSSTHQLINSPWVGSVGRLVAEKDYETFVEAAAMLPNANFFIIGSGYELPKLRSKIKKLGLGGRCFIVGELAPAAPYLKAFDIFVLTSIKEGLPYTMLEAMAADVPLVVTRVGGMTEIVKDRGLVMPPREPEEIARAIKYYLEHPEEAKKFALSAKRFLEEKLTLERIVNETERVYLL